jgi:macrolide transport system ATP-binding/permease protein
LALAIGVNTAIFSVVNALLVTRLPYPHPERLGTIFEQGRNGSTNQGPHAVNGKQWELLRDDVPAVLPAISGSSTGINLQSGNRIAYVQAGRISQHYLDVLGIPLAAGRNFNAVEDLEHGPNTAVLTFELWQSVFGGERSVLGNVIRLGGVAYTVIGVLPQGATTPLRADLYTALQPSAQGEGGGTNYNVILRLRDGSTWQDADAEINRAWASEIGARPNEPDGERISFYCVSLQRGLTASLRPKVLTLMLSAGFILLIACVNLAGLMLVQVSRRTPEFATRLALGASRWQLERQLWIENTVLTIAGGGVAVLVGHLALRALLSLLPAGFLPISGITIDGRVLGFTLLVALATCVFFGMLPPLTLRGIDLRFAMTSLGVTSPKRIALRQGLVAAEVSLTVLLLAGSGLLLRSLIHLETLPPGFDAREVITAKASLNDSRYNDPAAFRNLLRESSDALRRIPGVQSAAVGLSLPFEGTLNNEFTLSDGKEVGEDIGADFLYVTPSYFETLRIPLLAGRGFTDSDGPNTQPVAIVNQAFARKFYHGDSPLGRAMNKSTVIVGVVGDVQLSSNLNPIAPLQTEETVYVPAAQITERRTLEMIHTWFQPSWIVRTAGPIPGVTGEMQGALASVAAGLPFSGFYSMTNLQANPLSTQRIEAALLGTMACLALLLSAIGIFSLVASLVAQQIREIGIRLALGSTVRQALFHTAAPGLRASGLGLLLGMLFCAGALRTLRSALYGVDAFDWPTMLSVALGLALVALIAAVVPCLRIAIISVSETLRCE